MKESLGWNMSVSLVRLLSIKSYLVSFVIVTK